MKDFVTDNNTPGNAHQDSQRKGPQQKGEEQQMISPNENYNGYISGLIFDSTTEEIIGAEVTSLTPGLNIEKPLAGDPDEVDGVYFATGNPGHYRLRIATPAKDKVVEVDIRLTGKPQERHIYI